jgi:hypothetical protein
VSIAKLGASFSSTWHMTTEYGRKEGEIEYKILYDIQRGNF